MNRRSFVQRLVYGSVAAAALASVPIGVVQALGLERPVRFWAIDRLRWLYNDWTRLRRRGPELIVVGAEFYAALEDEMLTIARDTGLWFFVDGRLREPSLKFKGATVIARGRGYGIELRPVMEYAFNPA